MNKIPRLRCTALLFVLCGLITSLSCTSVMGQIQSKSKAKKGSPKENILDRMFFGGNMGLQFGDVTLIDVSPFAGYRFTDKLAAGLGITYQYYRDKRWDPVFSTSIYGTRVFGRYYVLDNLFAHLEYEVLNYDAIFANVFGNFKDRITAHNIYIGGGYSQPLGGRSSIDLMVLYNLNESAESLYQNPIIRMGVNIGM